MNKTNKTYLKNGVPSKVDLGRCQGCLCIDFTRNRLHKLFVGSLACIILFMVIFLVLICLVVIAIAAISLCIVRLLFDILFLINVPTLDLCLLKLCGSELSLNRVVCEVWSTERLILSELL